MIYLASPYSHTDPVIRDQRAKAAANATIDLIFIHRLTVFSPIVHGHFLWVANSNLPTDAKAWGRFNNDFIFLADELYVLCLEGWDVSIGVAEEIELAEKLGRPVRYLNPDLSFK